MLYIVLCLRMMSGWVTLYIVLCLRVTRVEMSKRERG